MMVVCLIEGMGVYRSAREKQFTLEYAWLQMHVQCSMYIKARLHA